VKVWLRKCANFDEEAAADREYWQQYTPSERVAQIRDLHEQWDWMNGRESIVNKDYIELFEALNRCGVHYVVVGAYAFAYYVRPRYTKDLDIFVDCSPANAQRVMRAVDEFGFGSLHLSVDDFAEGQVIQLGIEPKRIDFITRISGVTFEQAWSTRVSGDYHGVPVNFISRELLIRNKTASARPQDLADLALLR
jgi:hypothetical protein